MFPIRVLRIIARMNVGGPAIEIQTLHEELNEQEFQQLLLTGYCEDNELDFLNSTPNKIKYRRVPSLGRSVSLVQDFRAFLQVRKILKEFRPHILHTHTSKAGLIGRLAYLTTQQKVILFHTFHGHLLHGYFASFIVKSIEILERVLAKKTDVLISVGESIRDDLVHRKILPKKSFHVIPPGFNFTPFLESKSIRKELNLQPNQFVICWIGRFVNVKRPERIIEVAEKLKDHKNVVFLVVGEGDLYSQIVQQSKSKGLNIIYLGWRRDIPDILKSSNLLMLTSENEGTPIVLLEAQLSGLPVIATEVGSVPEVVMSNKTGYVLPYNDEDFSDLVLALASNPHRYQRMSFAAVEFVKENFSSEKFAINHANLYRNYTLNSFTDRKEFR